MNLLHYFNKKRELSPSNRKEYSLNEHGYVDLKNQFIDSSDLAKTNTKNAIFLNRRLLIPIEYIG